MDRDARRSRRPIPRDARGVELAHGPLAVHQIVEARKGFAGREGEEIQDHGTMEQLIEYADGPLGLAERFPQAVERLFVPRAEWTRAARRSRNGSLYEGS